MARKNRTKLISLDETTWELALMKPNFSEWVRNQLRSERNKSETLWKYCVVCDKSMQTGSDVRMNRNCDKFLDHKLEVLD